MTKQQDQSQIKWISDFIWNIADDRLRDVYVRGKYRDVICPSLCCGGSMPCSKPRRTQC